MGTALSTPKRGQRIRWEDVDRSRCDIQVALEALEQAKALKSPRTLGWYRSTLRAFRDQLSESGYPTTLDELTPEIVRTYLAEEAQRPYRRGHRIRHDRETGEIVRYWVEMPGRLSEHSLNTIIRCLRAFGRWLVKAGWLVASPFEGMEKAGAPKLRKKVLSEDEINRVLTRLNEQTDIGARDKAILWVFLDTGIRLSELATLDLDHVNLTDKQDGPWIQVIGKDRKERRTGLSPGARAALQHYVGLFRPEWVPFQAARVRALEARGIRIVREPLFLTVQVHGLDHPGGYQLLANAVQLIIGRLGKRAGVKGMSPHAFRRTFATQNLELGASPLDVMWDLGHSSLTMTNYYASLADQNRMRQHRQFSYMERFTAASPARERVSTRPAEVLPHQRERRTLGG